MAAEAPSDLRAQLDALLHHGALGGLSDSELLARFQDGDDPTAEAAFAMLVDRHGPMVLRVCRAALGTTHDAEDASHAVFLVLARQARSVRRRDSAASWLYGVARRVAARARRDDARRRKHERRRAELAALRAETPVGGDVCETIYREIDALPEIYRSALALCYLEGLSHEQAASWLRCPLRTLQSRLQRAKARLRDRLARRGTSLPALLLPLSTTTRPSDAWIRSTAEAAIAVAAGRALPARSGVSAATLTLAGSVLRPVALLPRIIALAAVGAGLVGLAVAVVSRGIGDDPPPENLPGPRERPVIAATVPDSQNRRLVLEVIQLDSRAPVEGAEVTVVIDSGTRPGFVREPVFADAGGQPQSDWEPVVLTRSSTDARGRCTVELPRVLPRELWIIARKSGYASQSYSPLRRQGAASIPAEHTMKLERGFTIGGIVKARGGQAVAGATVIIWSRAGTGEAAGWGYLPPGTVKTDDEGRWSFDEMPSRWEFVHVEVEHPDFVPTAMQTEPHQPSDRMLKANTAEIILDSGIALEGSVGDHQGRPIAGAKVGLGPDRRIADSFFPNVVTDSEGHFLIAHAPAGSTTVTVQSPGSAAESADVVVAPGMRALKFRLGPGRVIRGRVVDSKGEPLDGVTVLLVRWKLLSSLDWTATTDADGRFLWDSAPAEPVALTLTKPGYTTIADRVFSPDQAEAIVTMYSPLRIRGAVTDARTGKRIEQFTVAQGVIHRSWMFRREPPTPRWQPRGSSSEFTGGMCEVASTDPEVVALAVRIEASGYEPRTSATFKMTYGDVVFDARLEPARIERNR